MNCSSQHWFYTGRNGASQSHGGQLPLRLNASAGARMDIRLVQPTGGTYAPSGLLRLSDGGEREYSPFSSSCFFLPFILPYNSYESESESG